MSVIAQKRSVPPPVPPHVLHRSHGPVIDASRDRSTLLPPPNPIGNAEGRVPALSELVEQIVDESDAIEIDSNVARAPELQDTIVPNSGIVECAARLSAEPSPSSQVMAAAAQERAELDIHDYSLRLDNPYAPSSLVPPRPRNWGRTALLAVSGAVAAALATLAGSTLLPQAPVAPRNSERPSSIPVVHAAPVSPTPILPQGPIAADSLTVNPTEARAAATGAENRASTLAKPRGPRRERRARTGRKASPIVVPQPATPRASDPAPAAALPVTPTREQVVAGFSQVRGELARCAGGKSGVVEIQATILSSGRISTAMIGGQFEGTPEGSCMAKAARLASFGRFSQPMLKVRFPVAL